jgi:hypothetical protein
MQPVLISAKKSVEMGLEWELKFETTATPTTTTDELIIEGLSRQTIFELEDLSLLPILAVYVQQATSQRLLPALLYELKLEEMVSGLELKHEMMPIQVTEMAAAATAKPLRTTISELEGALVLEIIELFEALAMLPTMNGFLPHACRFEGTEGECRKKSEMMETRTKEMDALPIEFLKKIGLV